jgi:hypothetical protein
MSQNSYAMRINCFTCFFVCDWKLSTLNVCTEGQWSLPAFRTASISIMSSRWNGCSFWTFYLHSDIQHTDTTFIESTPDVREENTLRSSIYKLRTYSLIIREDVIICFSISVLETVIITNSVSLVLERAVTTKLPPLVGEVSANISRLRGIVWSARLIPRP